MPRIGEVHRARAHAGARRSATLAVALVVAAVAGARAQVPAPQSAPADSGEPAEGSAADWATRELISVQRDGKELYRRETRAVRRTGAIQIDGAITEEAWSAAPIVRWDWQESPDEGARATGPTEFRILYDDSALYVGVHAIDPAPDQIRAILHPSLALRKIPQSDWIGIFVDPPLDRRMGYAFAVNPLGVMVTFRSFAGGASLDDTYRPVWEVATRRDATGWYAEMRIPHSQTRVRDGYQDRWGFQMVRRWSRRQERGYWSPFTPRSGMEVKGYGTLVIGDRLAVGRPLELRPYLLGGGRLESVADGDALHDPASPEYGIGLDGTYQVTESARISATILPDFGQVEADPSEVNLTNQETFFSERRPFFVQDSDLYRFGLGRGVETLFHSRRIGARPHLSQAGAAPFVDEEDETTILGAVKLTAQLGRGVNLATLSALTAEERSRAQLPDGTIREATVEPMTAFNLLQVNRTFRGGSSDLRATATATNRLLDGTGIETLHRQAYAGGAQYLHQLRGDRWAVFGMLGGSHVEGPAAALRLTQQASRHAFQRPDAGHLAFDPERTAMSGYAFNAQVRRIGGFLQGAAGVEGRSPGFEVNDLGFQTEADAINAFARVDYVDSTVETGELRERSVSLALDTFTDFAPDILRHQVAAAARGVFRNNAALGASATFSRGVLDNRLLRGGPAVRGEDTFSGALTFDGNPGKDLQLGFRLNGQIQPESRSWLAGASLSVRWNIRPNLEVLVTPSLLRNINHAQFLGAAGGPDGGRHYFLGHLRQWELRGTTRVEYTVTPRMSLQLYVEPFLSAGQFIRILEATAPRAASYERRFTEVGGDRIDRQMDQLGIDVDGDGLSDLMIPQPDFRVGTLLSNLVYRWEYRPGSFLHLIWSQARRDRDLDGSLRPGDVADVFTNRSIHVVLAKLSYWWNL